MKNIDYNNISYNILNKIINRLSYIKLVSNHYLKK